MSTASMMRKDRSSSTDTIRVVLPLVLCAAFGFLNAFTVSYVGLIPVGELILAAAAVWAVVRGIINKGWPSRIQQLRWYKILLILVAVMAAGYVGSDLYRGTEGENLVRGWARVGFLGVDLLAITYLINTSWGRLYAVVFSLYIGNVVFAAWKGPLFGRWWEFGVGYPISAFVLFICAGRSALIQVVAAMVMAAASFVLGARSLGGICLLASILFGLRYARGVMRPVAVLSAAGALVTLLFAANSVILSNLGKEGSSIERQSMIETAGEAFIASPIIGQGSWFTASGKMLAQLEENREKRDPTFHHYSEDEGRTIAIHSQILVALAEGGILGGLFFFFYGLLLLKTLHTLTRDSMPHRAFLLYLVIAGLWNLCMSPFSGIARTEICVAICACLLVVLQRQGELSEDYRE